MRRQFTIVVVAAFWVGVTAGCRASEREAVDAASLYWSNCAGCHGVDGEGFGAATAGAPRDFTDAAWQRSRSNEELHVVVTSGKGEMPGFGEMLDAEEIAALVGYVRSLETADVVERAPSAGGAR